jgi:CO/xanthine dehydrogenase Mo-binding subunit
MINPAVVEGQVAGGTVQGIGGALLEQLAYDEIGNPITTTFMDYLLPTAAEVPVIEWLLSNRDCARKRIGTTPTRAARTGIEPRESGVRATP